MAEDVNLAAATIRDVAKRAGVSVASVSRAMNGAANVNPQMHERVMAAAAALGYVPHAGARSLSTARQQAIGVVLPDLYGEFFSELMRGLDRETSARGYHLLLSNTHADPALATQVIRAMRGRVDGLIVMAPQLDSAVIAAALPQGLPTVFLNSPDDGDRTGFRIDNVAGAAAMTRHLIDQGRRRIVHLSGDLANLDARERRDGYRAALDGLPEHIIEGDFQEESGVSAARALLAAGVAFDAVFAANDMMALGMMHTLRSAGLAVPRAVAIAGFDDVPLAHYLRLSTVHVDIDEMGAVAAKRLIGALEGQPLVPGIDRIATRLAIRETTQ